MIISVDLLKSLVISPVKKNCAQLNPHAMQSTGNSMNTTAFLDLLG